MTVQKETFNAQKREKASRIFRTWNESRIITNTACYGVLWLCHKYMKSGFQNFFILFDNGFCWVLEGENINNFVFPH